MSTPDPDLARRESSTRRRVRFELVFASVWLAIGLFLLPALIYMVGILLLGPYGEGAGLGRFYADFFGDLAGRSGRAWGIALGPLILISVLRLLFLDVRPGKPQDEDATPPVPPPAQRSAPRSRRGPSRVEPRISLE